MNSESNWEIPPPVFEKEETPIGMRENSSKGNSAAHQQQQLHHNVRKKDAEKDREKGRRGHLYGRRWRGHLARLGPSFSRRLWPINADAV